MRNWFFLYLCLFCLWATAYAAPVVTTQEVEEALTCQCSCGLTVHSCNHLECGFGIPAKQEIAHLMSEGKSIAEILSQFTAKYGEKILSAPTTSGFNLLAWITPFFTVLVGGLLVVLVAIRWNRKATAVSAEIPTAEALEHYRARLQKELETFDR
jgi:cytochrome c-type biogenesis protein CcmH